MTLAELEANMSADELSQWAALWTIRADEAKAASRKARGKV